MNMQEVNMGMVCVQGGLWERRRHGHGVKVIDNRSAKGECRLGERGWDGLLIQPTIEQVKCFLVGVGGAW